MDCDPEECDVPPWGLNKDIRKSESCIFSREIKKNTQELSGEKNHVPFHRKKKCFLTDFTEKRQQ